ncbi:MAG: asparaginase [Litoreibacter sp.]|nr:asparaginase [Litoreibacter sp.]
MSAEQMVEIWRGEHLESLHRGHAVVCHEGGDIVASWGDPEKLIYPRSSYKMLQALPLVESGAAQQFKLKPADLALACASHSGAAIHTDHVTSWLGHLGLTEDAFHCGPQEPFDKGARDALIRAEETPCRRHNNCSGKHCGFLTLSQHLGVDLDYVALDHPVQKAVKTVIEEMTGVAIPGHGIDGCSAPNYLTTVKGLARAMARMTKDGSDPRSKASRALIEAMMAHPEKVAGEGRACTELMRAAGGAAAIKTGAEGVYVGILPEQQLGVAIKIEDGASRAAEAAIAGLLIKFGALDANHPIAKKYTMGPIKNWDGLETGFMRLSLDFVSA